MPTGYHPPGCHIVGAASCSLHPLPRCSLSGGFGGRFAPPGGGFAAAPRFTLRHPLWSLQVVGRLPARPPAGHMGGDPPRSPTCGGAHHTPLRAYVALDTPRHLIISPGFLVCYIPWQPLYRITWPAREVRRQHVFSFLLPPVFSAGRFSGTEADGSVRSRRRYRQPFSWPSGSSRRETILRPEFNPRNTASFCHLENSRFTKVTFYYLGVLKSSTRFIRHSLFAIVPLALTRCARGSIPRVRGCGWGGVAVGWGLRGLGRSDHPTPTAAKNPKYCVLPGLRPCALFDGKAETPTWGTLTPVGCALSAVGSSVSGKVDFTPACRRSCRGT
ncbi:hypothetical protein ES705_31238 [subsurface metagenome]